VNWQKVAAGKVLQTASRAWISLISLPFNTGRRFSGMRPLSMLLPYAGVPFVLRAGKALNERSVVVRMQLHAHPVPLFGPSAAHNEMRNEFVMRLQPGEHQ